MPIPTIIEEQFRPSDGRFLRRTEQGWEAARVWHVNTPVEADAIVAPGVPALGAAHPDAAALGAPNLRVRNLSATMYVGPKPDNTSPGNLGGWTKIVAAYATPGLRQQSGGTQQIPREAMIPGAAFSEWQAQDGTVTVFTDKDGVRLVGDSGVSVPSTRLELIVRKYVDRPPDITQFFDLVDRVNDAAFTIPEFYGVVTPAPRQIAAGQVVFLMPQQRRIDSGLFEIAYRLPARPDWKDRRRATDPATGAPVGPVIESDVLPTFSTSVLVALLNQAP
jgi:hypothetical protein